MMMYDAAIMHATRAAQTAADTAADGGGVSSLLVVLVAGVSVVLAAGVVRAALKVFSALLSAAIRVGTAVIALGFGALVFGVVYVANMVFNFVPS
jgi:hypothetical protein